MPYFEPTNTRFIDGSFTFATLPSAAANRNKLAWTSDMGATGTYCVSDGTMWEPVDLKRIETYNGVTNASGDYTVVFPVPYAVAPHINPQTSPSADSITRVRVTARSTTGFTVKTEKNATVNLLGVDILGIGTANVPSVPVQVVVVEV